MPADTPPPAPPPAEPHPPPVEGGEALSTTSLVDVPLPPAPPGTARPRGLRLTSLRGGRVPPSDGGLRLPFLSGVAPWVRMLVVILVGAGAILLAMYLLGVFDDEAPAPVPAGVWDACEKGDLVSSITVSTEGGVVEILEEAGPLGAAPWLEYPDLSWNLAYEGLYEYGPRGPALEARLTGRPGSRVCFRMAGDPADRSAELLGTDVAANVSMQWVMVLAGSDDSLLTHTNTNYAWTSIQAAVGEDGRLAARWRDGGDGTSATYSLVRLEILVEWERTLEAG